MLRVNDHRRVVNGDLEQVGKAFKEKKIRGVCAVFRCKCGTHVILLIDNVVRSHTTSCGCNKGEAHGKTGTPEYITWQRMMQRCASSAKGLDRKNYYDRGIRVCERWNSFSAFIEDMGDRPGPKFSIERNDNNKGYCQENCRWATASEQAKNRRSTIMIEIDGQTKCLKDWAAIHGIPYLVVYKRLKMRNWSIQRALQTPLIKKG